MSNKTVKQTELPEGWVGGYLKDVLNYIQPTKYIVKSTDYKDSYKTPVLTAGKSFIKGYTNEKDSIFQNLPVIIFDDFTTATQFVDFPFKVKSSAMKILIPASDLVNVKFVFYFMQTIRENTDTHKRYWISIFSQLPIKIPPMPEQHRIVDKIEELFTKLDAGVEALERVRKLLGQYRRSVLKAAFEGKLTRNWRESERADPESELRKESAADLLEKIRAEREKNGKKVKDTSPVDTSELPELPKGWVWAKISSIGDISTGTTPKKSISEYYGDTYPFYKPSDLDAGYHTKSSLDGLSEQGIKNARKLPPKSILITCIGATIGKTGLSRYEGATNQQINAITPYKSIIPELVYFMCISPFFQKSIKKNASSTTLPILNKTKFSNLLIPIPPSAEQREIVQEIERRFSIADHVEKSIEEGIKKSDALRRSILKKAFEGKLVPQDPSDEPADKLLERIKNEKEVIKAS